MNNVFALKEYKTNDTIAAIATFPSRSALGIIKISGTKALAAVQKIFVPANKKTRIVDVPSHTIHYGWIYEKVKGIKDKGKSGVIDEVIITIMREPRSYTCQNVAEISCHGGIFALNKILKLCISAGCRLALPGEFTYRALMSGRIDLLQAQSVLDIIEAKNQTGLVSAVAQLQGKTSQTILALKNQLKEIYAQSEALISFPENDLDISAQAISLKLKQVYAQLRDIVYTGAQTRILKEGLRCVICGRANAGKSTLFNRLLNEERVIVSSAAGTTRDVVEETIYIEGIPLRIYDTAGILEPKDLISKKALEKTRQTFDLADLVIILIDASKKLSADDKFFIERGKDKKIIIVLNKIDKGKIVDERDLNEFKQPKLWLSLAKNSSIKELEKTIRDSVYKQGINRQDMIFLSQYQQCILDQTVDNIKQALSYLQKEQTFDFANACVKDALMNLNKLTGEVFCREIMEDIFKNFCIGK